MISFAHLDDVIIGGCAVAMVAFADTSVLSRTYAAKIRTPVDPNQEMIGWAQPISPPAFFRDSRSAAAHHALRSQKRPVRRRSSPEWWVRSQSRSF
jgi:Sulfate permease and related transporters (MFS superfamily)